MVRATKQLTCTIQSQSETENVMCETQVGTNCMLHSLQHQRTQAKIEVTLYAVTTVRPLSLLIFLILLFKPSTGPALVNS